MMAAMNVLPPKPDFVATPATPLDFGPDATHTPKTPPKPPKVNQENPPKSTESVFEKLGTNKKLRSPVRRLTREAPKDELSDLDRLAVRYEWLSNVAKPFHPNFSQAVFNQRYACAEAWFELADNNDKVRRWILAFIEGGAWGGVAAAHAPIFVAVIPERTLNMLFMRGMGMFTKDQTETVENLPYDWAEQDQ